MRKNVLVAVAAGLLLSCATQKKNMNDSQVAGLDLQGHRGSRGLMPENTIPAMLKAIDLGVQTLEMDVVISADKQVVVSHDVYFSDNITTTPEGLQLSKAEAQKRLLYKMDYDSIRRYDVGLKVHPDFPRQQKIAVSKPLLSDLVSATEQYAKGKGRAMMYNIEVKSKPENDGKKHPPIEEFVDLVMKTINGLGIESRTTIQSFDPRALQVLHKKYPGITASLLMEGSDKRGLNEQLNQLGFTPQIYSPHFSLVTPALIAQCRQKDIKVIPWTVNNVEEMKRLKALGVDGIISDYPDLFEQLW